MRYFTICFLIFVLAMPLFGAVEVQSYVDRTKVGMSDTFTLSVEVSSSGGEDVEKPDFPNVDFVENLGVSTSTSSSYTMVNGKMSSSKTNTYTFTLQPIKKGNFVIPPITIKYKGKAFSTKPIGITVVEGSTRPAPRASSPFQRSGNPPEQDQKLEDNLFIETQVSRQKAYKGEPIRVTYMLFTRYNVTNMSFSGDPDYKGFWKEDIFTANKVAFDRVSKDGISYNRMKLSEIELIPNESGTLTIPGLEMNVELLKRSRDFFDFDRTNSYRIKGPDRKIQVRELPYEGRPDNFSGAIGKFNIQSRIDKNELKVGDSFTYTIKLTGDGNFMKFEMPMLPELQHLHFLAPEIKSDARGKTAKYPGIAQEEGTFTIPAVEFSYFNPKSERYVTDKTPAYTLHVSPGEGMPGYISRTPGVAQSAVEMEGMDIDFIVRETDLTSYHPYLTRPVYWLIWLAIFLLIPAAGFYARERRKAMGNIDYIRQRKARSILRKYLKQASNEVGKIEFYASAQTGLSNYLADKLRLPRGSTSDALLSSLSAKQTEAGLLERLKAFFERCNQARFMPGGFSAENIREDFTTLKALVGELSKMRWK